MGESGRVLRWAKDEMTDQEINEAVAKKLGGERRTLPDAYLEDGTVVRHYPDYCRSIAAAWEIVEKFPSMGLFRTNKGNWYCCPNFGLSEESEGEWYFRAEKNSPFESLASTPAMAISLAFLKLPSE